MKSLLRMPRINNSANNRIARPPESGNRDDILSVIPTGHVGFRDI